MTLLKLSLAIAALTVLSLPSAQAMSKGRPVFGDGFVTQTLSETYFFSEIRSCYRWMPAIEKEKWLEGKVRMSGESFADFLRRVNRKNEIIYCWSNPVGALMGRALSTDGSFPYSYGDELARIDFVADPVFYLRNTGQYFRLASQDSIPDDFKMDVDTEVVYSAYASCLEPKNLGFQEYTIRSPDVIQGWTFSDDALKSEFRKRYAEYSAGVFPWSDMHFPYHLGQPFYSEELNSKKQHIESGWSNGERPRYFVNPSARAHL